MIPRYRLQPLMVLCRTLCRMISRVRIQPQTNDQSQIAPGERARRSCQVQFGNWSVRRLCRSRFSRNALCASALLMPSWPKRRLGAEARDDNWPEALAEWAEARDALLAGTPRRRPARTSALGQKQTLTRLLGVTLLTTAAGRGAPAATAGAGGSGQQGGRPDNLVVSRRRYRFETHIRSCTHNCMR